MSVKHTRVSSRSLRVLLAAGIVVLIQFGGSLHAARPHPSVSNALSRHGKFPQAAGHSPETSAQSRAVLDRYCVTCHSQRLHTGGLVLEGTDLAKVGENAELWEKVVRKLASGSM